MRSTGLLVVAAAAVAHAGYTEKDGKYYCEESNASYCLGGDIILRCDAYGVGTPGRCSDNYSGYSPASCYEKVHGEAVCEPSHPSSVVDTLTTIYTHPVPETTTKPYYNTTIPGYPGESSKPGQPEESSKPGHHNYPGNATEPGQPGHPTATGYTTKCVTIVYPNPTKSGESSTRTITYTTAVYPPGTETEHPHYPPQTTMYPVPSGGPARPPHNSTYSGPGGKGIYGEQNNGQQGSPSGDNNDQAENGQKGVEAASETETNVPVKPTSTSEPDVVTGAGVATNPVSGLLALAAVVAAYLI